LIFKAQRERGMTLLLVTHDQSLAARCDRQVRMRSGWIEEEVAVKPAKKAVKA
jgi:putative ABC transport system ATP-binding protein